MSKLKLSSVLDDTPVKLTVELPAPIHRDLVAYSEALKTSGGRAVEPAKLVPPMIARFMGTDREFVRMKRACDKNT
jgi:hypothetical protein